MIAPECPICAFRIRGSNHAGYRCVQCHARYSPQFVRRLRRAQIREVIETHFGVSRIEEIEEERFVVPFAEPSDFTSAPEEVESHGEDEEFVDLADIVSRELRGEVAMPKLRESAADAMQLDDDREILLEAAYDLAIPKSIVRQQPRVRTKQRGAHKSATSKQHSVRKKIASVKKSSQKKPTRRRR